MDWDHSSKPRDGLICPDCPVFYPTIEEFRNPLKYIDSIRPIGERSGICKVVPPDGWRPPFSIDERKFSFRSKIQSLNAIEGVSRAEGGFIEELRLFLYKHGKPMKTLPVVNLNQLYRVVLQRGGFTHVDDHNAWDSVAADMAEFLPDKKTDVSTSKFLRQQYYQYLYDYEVEKNPEMKKQVKLGSPEPPTAAPDHKLRRPDDEDINKTPKKATRYQMQAGKTNSPRKLLADQRRKTRLNPPEVNVGQQFFKFFPGHGSYMGEIRRIHGKTVYVSYRENDTKEEIPYDEMPLYLANGATSDTATKAATGEICQFCLRADCWDRMLLCDGCNGGYHMFCLDNPITEVPQGDWYCIDCVAESQPHEEVKSFGFQSGPKYSFLDFKKMADTWKGNYFVDALTVENPEPSEKMMEQEYWKILATPVHQQRINVEYGSDLDSGALGSGFPRMDRISKVLQILGNRNKARNGNEVPDILSSGYKMELDAAEIESQVLKYAEDGWNLNNLPKLSGSVLQYLGEDITGVMVPWIYIGMCYSTFCWHAEDHNFYSISYLHCGAPKTWYGIPGSKAAEAEKAMKSLTPDLFSSQPDLHLQLVTMFSPEKLQSHGIPVYRATHRPNEFMITFPSAYHAGYNNGFNCAEAVNFATADWIPWGKTAVMKYKSFRKVPVFSHESLLCALGNACTSIHAKESVETAALLRMHFDEMINEFELFKNAVEDFGVVDSRQMAAVDIDKMMEAIVDAASHRQQHPRKRRRLNRLAIKSGGSMAHTKQATGPGGRPRVASSKPMRPDRMGRMDRMARKVEWAGGSSKGMRCFSCKQYCFLSAVICKLCIRNNRNLGLSCADHFQGMCSCDVAENYIFLYRFELGYLRELSNKIHERANAIGAWRARFDEFMKGFKQAKSSSRALSSLKSLYSEGTKLSASVEDLRLIRQSIDDAEAWGVKMSALFPRRQTNRRKGVVSQEASTSINDLEALVVAAQSLQVVPNDFSILESLVDRVCKWQKRVRVLFSNFSQFIVSREAVEISKLNCSDPKCQDTDVDLKSQFKEKLHCLCEESIELKVLSPEYNAVQRETACQEWLSRANELCRLSIGSRSSDVVAETFELLNDPCISFIAEPEKAKELIALTQMKDGIEEARKTIADAIAPPISFAKLEKVYTSLSEKGIPVDELTVIESKIASVRKWKSDVELAFCSGTDLSSLENLCRHAEELQLGGTCHTTKSVRHCLKDCRRWVKSARTCFMKGSDTRPVLTVLQQVLDDAKRDERNRKKGLPIVVPDDTKLLHCVCQQPHIDGALMIQCEGNCQKWFHPICIGLDVDSLSNTSFTCTSCEKNTQSENINDQVYCVCRTGAKDRMVSCDFCSEWYHLKCVWIKKSEASAIASYRCPACCIKEQIPYAFMDPSLSRSKATKKSRHQTKVPSLKSVEDLVNGSESLPCQLAEVTCVKELFAIAKSAAAEASELVISLKDNNLDSFQAGSALLEQLSRLEIHVDVLNDLRSEKWRQRCNQMLSSPECKVEHLNEIIKDAENQKLDLRDGGCKNLFSSLRDMIHRAYQWVSDATQMLSTSPEKQDVRDFLHTGRDVFSKMQYPDEYKLLQRKYEDM